MSKKVDLRAFITDKEVQKSNEFYEAIRKGIPMMKAIYDEMKAQGFSDEFIALYLTNMGKD